MRKAAIITGGNAGLGFHCAERAIVDGFDVTLACRNIDKAEAAKSRLLDRFPKSRVSVVLLDLSDLESARSFVGRFEGNWDLLINNAGAKIEKPFKQTSQGHEWHIGVNHLGHFALTGSLLSKANENATIVTVSSIVARRGTLEFELEVFDERKAYANSKLMNLVFSQELARRLSGTGHKSVAAHPGFARASYYGNRMIRAAEYCFAHSAVTGSESIWQAANTSNGKYLAPRFLELWGSPSEARSVRTDSAAVLDFWNESERLTGVRFAI